VFIVRQTDREGRKHGTQVHYYPNGDSMIVEHYVHGCGADTTRMYYEGGGTRSLQPFADCHKHGKWVSFHENGDTASYGFLENGKHEGAFKVFFESGKLKQRTHYKNDKRHGPMVFYLEDGTRIDSIIYEQGDIVEEFRYFRNGELRIKAKYLSKTNKNITHYDPEGNVTGKIRNGKGEGVYWADDDSGGYRSYHVRYEDGRRVYE